MMPTYVAALPSQQKLIQMDVQILDRVWTADVTLANRDEMGFRMLLGRQALRRHFLVDPSRSFLTGQP